MYSMRDCLTLYVLLIHHPPSLLPVLLPPCSHHTPVKVFLIFPLCPTKSSPNKISAKKVGRIDDDRCPKCLSAPETLAHVLNACTTNTGLMRTRHNEILQRLMKAVPNAAGDVFVEQKVPDSPGDLHPNLIAINHSANVATIVDVTLTF